MKIALLGTYLPKKCGIATFTSDVYQSIINAENSTCDVIAVGNNKYSDEVCMSISENCHEDYVKLAKYLNEHSYHLLCIQHEYGIFGQNCGEQLITLLELTTIPIVTTLHTVIESPNNIQYEILQKIVKHSRFLVVMSHKAIDLLQTVYHVPAEQICYIAHGVPDMPYNPPSFYKHNIGYENKKLLLTFGLCAPGKGIEDMLCALPEIVEAVPDAFYLLAGAIHPNYAKTTQHDYAQVLMEKANYLGMRDYFAMENRFLPLAELLNYIGAADVYITPYLNKQQIVSGALSYAKAMGKPLVSTPYWHAEEIITNEKNGYLVPFKDYQALAKYAIQLLTHPRQCVEISNNNYKEMRSDIWSQSGKHYIDLFHKAMNPRLRLNTTHNSTSMLNRKTNHAGKAFIETDHLLKQISLKHLLTLTDDTGIFQHATYNIPDRAHGYCVDDNARALIVATKLDKLSPDNFVYQRLISVYLSFLMSALNRQTGRFHNFMSHNRLWLDEHGSDDSQGRAIWGLGVACRWCQNDKQRKLAQELITVSSTKSLIISSPRGIAFTILGLCEYLQQFPSDLAMAKILYQNSQNLADLIETYRPQTKWQWFETSLTYDNARIPQAMLAAGQQLKNKKMVAIGLEQLNFLITLQFPNEDSVFLPIGNANWCHDNGKRAYFDQQPLEALAMIEACFQAMSCYDNDSYRKTAECCLGWFLGDNVLGKSICDLEQGACCDGLMPTDVNHNQGAESTLCWLLSVLAFCPFETYQVEVQS
ncbi:MAG: glycosyltransferase [Gammaproteobacteria bacterium]|nr:glycosyltransferase [Gammaproteobacteria bacterium]